MVFIELFTYTIIGSSLIFAEAWYLDRDGTKISEWGILKLLGINLIILGVLIYPAYLFGSTLFEIAAGLAMGGGVFFVVLDVYMKQRNKKSNETLFIN